MRDRTHRYRLPRALNLLALVALICAGLLPGALGKASAQATSATVADLQTLDPRFTTFPEWNYIEGWEWPLGATVHLTIEDEATPQSPDYEQDGVVVAEPDPWVTFSFGDAYDMKPGDEVTLSDGVVTRTHAVRILAVTAVDEVADTVSGTADPGAEVYVWPHATGEQVLATADAGGVWQVDFTDVFDLGPGDGGRSEIRDEQGNATAVDWQVPNPCFTAFPEQEVVEGWDWPLGATVHLTIDDPGTEASPDLEQDGTVILAPWGSGQHWVWLDFVGTYDMKPGDEVTLSDGDTPRTHTVRNLAITEISETADTVCGTADPDTEVFVWPYATGEPLSAVANAEGVWQVDFTGVFDLMPGEGIRSEIRDEAGNATAVDGTVPPPPWLMGQITEDWFEARSFRPNTEVTFWVYDGEGNLALGPLTATSDGNGNAGIWVGDQLDLLPGQRIVATDGTTTKELVLEALTFDVFDLSEGHLEGTAAEPWGRTVWIGIGWDDDYWTMEVTTDGSGHWSADFHTSVPGDYQWVAAQIFDDDGDASEVRPELVVRTAAIDIKASDGLNLQVCRNENGLLSVAVLSSDEFDATALDADTVRFGRTGVEAAEVHVAKDGHAQRHVKDANGDGLLDMVFHFRLGDTGFTCDDIPSGQNSAAVEGKLTGMAGDILVRGVQSLVLFAAPPSAPADRVVTVGNFYVQWSDINPEEVLDLRWRGSPNLTNPWANPYCEDDLEFFGNSWASENGGTPPSFFQSLVGWGTTGTWTEESSTEVVIESEATGCPGPTGIPVNTTYRFYEDAPRADLFSVRRTFDFGANPYEHNLRSFIPRLYPKDGFTQVVYPDAGGSTLVTKAIDECPFGCEITDWNGAWFAMHNPTTGQGVVVTHEPSTYDVALWVDNDDGSFTNASCVLLLQPSGGFAGIVTETEYLFFYNSSTWTPSLTLPAGSQP